MKSFDHMVLEWASKQPADGTYNYCDPGNCALCMFLRDTGMAKEPHVVPKSWRDGKLSQDRHPYSITLLAALRDGPHTFGALADRLSTALLEKVG